MPAPSPLAIATGSVTRLMKEEATYHSELADGEAQLHNLEAKLRAGEPDPDGNADFLIRQQKMSIEQTRAVFGPLRERIRAAAGKLGDLLEAEDKHAADDEVDKARAALDKVKAVLEK